MLGDEGKSYTKMNYPSNLIICIRNLDVECSTVILIQTIEISHTRDAYGVLRWDESNKSMYKKFNLGETVRRADYGGIEWVKHSDLRWFGCVMEINEDNFEKSIQVQD